MYTLPPEVDEADVQMLPLPERNRPFPTVQAVARALRRLFDWDELVRTIRMEKNTPDWMRDFARNGHVAMPVQTIDALQNGYVSGRSFEGMSAFLQIPWEEFDRRMEKDETGEVVDASLAWAEVYVPAADLIELAMNQMKPGDLPGRFTLDTSSGDYMPGAVLIYEEGVRQEEGERQVVDIYYGKGVLDWTPED